MLKNLFVDQPGHHTKLIVRTFVGVAGLSAGLALLLQSSTSSSRNPVLTAFTVVVYITIMVDGVVALDQRVKGKSGRLLNSPRWKCVAWGLLVIGLAVFLKAVV